MDPQHHVASVLEELKEFDVNEFGSTQSQIKEHDHNQTVAATFMSFSIGGIDHLNHFFVIKGHRRRFCLNLR